MGLYLSGLVSLILDPIGCCLTGCTVPLMHFKTRQKKIIINNFKEADCEADDRGCSLPVWSRACTSPGFAWSSAMFPLRLGKNSHESRQ